MVPQAWHSILTDMWSHSKLADLRAGIQRIGNLDPYLQQLLDLQGPSADQVFQGLPLHVLHHDESIPVQLVNFVDGTDVGMIQRRRSTRLSTKAL